MLIYTQNICKLYIIYIYWIHKYVASKPFYEWDIAAVSVLKIKHHLLRAVSVCNVQVTIHFNARIFTNLLIIITCTLDCITGSRQKIHSQNN